MKHVRLWLFLMAGTMVILTVSSLFPAAFSLYLLHQEQLSPTRPIPWLPVGVIIGISLMFSLFLLALASRFFFIPIRKLILALNQVAKGNFQVSLPESGADAAVREMNQNFNKMVHQLNSINTLQTDFIQNVSHEYKTPLAVIEGYASLLKAAPLSPELHQYVLQILESTRQLSSLTSNVLKLSKLENQTIISEKKKFLLDEQIRRIILSMEPLWSRKELEIQLDLTETLFYGNEELMGQVWINLLSNAIKFTPKQGRILIQMKKTADSVLIKFQDNGIGMSDTVKKHIFDRFYQGDPSRNKEGNGLGLSLVKKIVFLCSGTISAESKEGEGSCFLVTLPLQPDDNEPV